jgi:hypothetical protein
LGFHERQVRSACGQAEHGYDKYVSRDAMAAGTFTERHCDESRQHSQSAGGNVKN